jgi:uncharacterized membrane protein YraQ (UPF0718 family)
MRPSSSLFRFFVTLVVAVVLAFCIPVFVDSHEYTRAVYNWTENPSVENRAMVTEETAKRDRIALITHLAAVGLFFALTNAGWLVLVPRSGSKH